MNLVNYEYIKVLGKAWIAKGILTPLTKSRRTPLPQNCGGIEENKLAGSDGYGSNMTSRHMPQGIELALVTWQSWDKCCVDYDEI